MLVNLMNNKCCVNLISNSNTIAALFKYAKPKSTGKMLPGAAHWMQPLAPRIAGKSLISPSTFDRNNNNIATSGLEFGIS